MRAIQTISKYTISYMHIIMWVLYFILGTSIEKDKNLAILLAIVLSKAKTLKNVNIAS